ncbi:hypothetical protein KV697_09020 [Sphingomonas sanguinis]|uniref:hypothetical protein n=1 Tax=Sphingomonas sanguinis TaxID=33051 RepID=UPI001C57F0B7|nr:hypothetical protein [Sphingomonas sanguinis]QXT37387.1 hypothetical protein KV697_09020 [Sphingomonas sanguinis]
MVAAGLAAAAVCAAATFLIERLRLGTTIHAMLEAGRLGLFSALSVIGFNLALKAREPMLQGWIAAALPILSALIVNNIYVALRRRAGKG